MKTSSWKIVLCFLAVFAAGLAAGGLLTWRLTRVSPPKPGAQAEQVLARLDHQLGLTGAEREQMAEAMRQVQPEWRRLALRQIAERQQLVDAFQERIAPLLDDAQRARLEAIRRQRAERIRRLLGAPEPGS